MVVKRSVEMEGLVRANRAAAQLLRELAALAKPGVRTADLDAYARKYIADLGAQAVFNTEARFPAAINTSVNDAVLHGVPNDYVLRAGDLLSIDAGLRLNGYCGDAATTVAIGELSRKRRKLVETAMATMEAGIAVAIAGRRVGDIGHAMQSYAEERGYGVMRGFTGHGLGRKMHEWPSVPFVGDPGTGPRLVDGMVITIEPAIVEGSPEWVMDPDGWTVRTVDGGWGAQFEHAVVVGRHGARILSAG
ncbi:MAG: type I methionyl aminopeptidase [Thermomicrobiales bacterium]